MEGGCQSHHDVPAGSAACRATSSQGPFQVLARHPCKLSFGACGNLHAEAVLSPRTCCLRWTELGQARQGRRSARLVADVQLQGVQAWPGCTRKSGIEIALPTSTSASFQFVVGAKSKIRDHIHLASLAFDHDHDLEMLAKY